MIRDDGLLLFEIFEGLIQAIVGVLTVDQDFFAHFVEGVAGDACERRYRPDG
jgi:hypothetical protein